MTEREAMTRAICAEPEDDTVRLAFADWCDENGEPERAEFIRVQIELARQPGEDQCPQCYAAYFGQQHTNGPCRCSPKVRSLRFRERAAFTRNIVWSGWMKSPVRRDVLAPAQLVDLKGLAGCLFRRGFLEELHLPTAAFLQHAETIFRAHPVTSVKLTDLEPESRYDDRAAEWYDDRNRERWRDARDKCFVPTEIFAHLTGGRLQVTTGFVEGQEQGRVRIYSRIENSTDLARDAISAACVAFGRSLADLPAWEPRRVAA